MAISTERKQFPLFYVNQHSRGIVGWGAHQMAGAECHANGIKHALLVTTGLKGTGIVDEVEGVLKANGVAVTRFDKVTSNPKDYECKEGTRAYLDAGCDGIVSVGGGSAHDAGKGIRIMLTNDGPDTDLRPFAAFLDPHYTTKIPTFKVVNIPHVAINTTTGTGAEGTAFAIINDEEWVYKLILIVPGVSPSVGIDDPAFLRLQPPHILAWSGIDAFCHAMEPFIGRLNFPVAHGTGYRALKLLSENLRQAYANPANDVAIENLAWAQFMASMSYNMGGGMGMVHGLAHMLSVIKDLHHGYSNAIMMMPVERFNVVAVPEKFKEIGMAMSLDVHHMNPVQAADVTLDAIERLRNDVGIPQVPLKEFDFTEKDIDHTVKWCLNDISWEANPRDMTADHVREIMRGCI
ncbi:MAG: iron-containing alcohol dehydrogenase [Deltaproteobacteria bacterium]|nr:iron-containing alcohol dehydrogenase [Deltaproteobacteria bacterium]